MPLESASLPPRKTPLKLIALTAVVLLAHGGLLYGTPLTMAVASLDAPATFSTRMIAPPDPEPPVAVLPAAIPVRKLVARAAPAARTPVTAATAVAEAPALQTPSAEVGPSTATAEPPAPAEPILQESAYSRMGQLLAANGPPANLYNATPMAAQDEAKATPLPATSAPSAGGPSAKLVSGFVFPPPMHLKYKVNGEVKGFPYYVRGDLQWQQDGKSYEGRLEVSHFLLGSRVQTSKGDLGPRGLEPIRFGDKVRSEVAAHFDRIKGKVTFSANTPDAPLLPGTQDQLSAFMQLASMLAGAPNKYPEGITIAFDAVGPRSVESWLFKVSTAQKLDLPGGQIDTIRLTRESVGDYGTRGEIWLAPSMGYLPVRIRVTEANNDFMDMKWSDTKTP